MKGLQVNMYRWSIGTGQIEPAAGKCKLLSITNYYSVRVARGAMEVFHINVQFAFLVVVSSMYSGFCCCLSGLDEALLHTFANNLMTRVVMYE
jgi:hypothetical protein